MTKTAITDFDFNESLRKATSSNLQLVCGKEYADSAAELLKSSYKIGRNGVVTNYSISLKVDDAKNGWELVSA